MKKKGNNSPTGVLARAYAKFTLSESVLKQKN